MNSIWSLIKITDQQSKTKESRSHGWRLSRIDWRESAFSAHNNAWWWSISRRGKRHLCSIEVISSLNRWGKKRYISLEFLFRSIFISLDYLLINCICFNILCVPANFPPRTIKHTSVRVWNRKTSSSSWIKRLTPTRRFIAEITRRRSPKTGRQQRPPTESLQSNNSPSPRRIPHPRIITNASRWERSLPTASSCRHWMPSFNFDLISMWHRRI